MRFASTIFDIGTQAHIGPETFRVFTPAAVGGNGVDDKRNVLITQLIPPRGAVRLRRAVLELDPE